MDSVFLEMDSRQIVEHSQPAGRAGYISLFAGEQARHRPQDGVTSEDDSMECARSTHIAQDRSHVLVQHTVGRLGSLSGSGGPRGLSANLSYKGQHKIPACHEAKNCLFLMHRYSVVRDTLVEDILHTYEAS